jgi:tetratricopeptide (TPR) repeat protein
MLDRMGLHYHMIGQLDSANYYYEEALALIPDTNNVTYRDVKTAHTLLSYRTGKNPQLVMEQLHGLLIQSESDGEYLSRCLTIGNVFYDEQQFDSALTYLNKVFDESTRIGSRKQAAEWLVEICKSQGKSYEPYADFLVPFANQEENNSGIKSQITKQYNEYNQRKQELVDNNTRKRLKRNGLSVVGIMLALVGGFVIYHIISQRKHRLLQIQMTATAKQLEDERQAHRVQQAALGSRLKQKNLALKELSATHETKPAIKPSPPEAVGDYTAEAICQHILSVCSSHQNPIKSSLPSSAYANIALNDKQKVQLKNAANRHFGNLFENLKEQHPELKDKDFLYCSLCLLELNNVQIAVLLQKSTSTIWEREKRLQAIFGKKEKIAIILNSLMNN